MHGETLTLQAFLFEKKVNHDPPVLSIPLVPLAPSLADCELSAQITGAKKQESLGSLSRHNSRPFFVCVATATQLLTSVPTMRSTCVD